MAISKSFFGLRTGSTKSLTFQTLRGQQITKDRVTSVSNPQTIAQMDQRLLLPMVANARTRLAGLVDHSFEGVPYGYQSLQKFSSLNLQKGALTVSSYVPKGLSDPGRANFIIADGSLHAPLQDPALVKDDSILLFSSGIALSEEPKTKIFPAMPAGTKGSTVMYYLNRYMATEDGLSWFSPNSQLTFLGQGTTKSAKYTASDGSEKDYPLSSFAVMRLVSPAAYPADKKPGTALTVDELANYHDDNDKFVLAEDVPAGGLNKVFLNAVGVDLGMELGFFKMSKEGEEEQEFEFGFSPSFVAVHDLDFALACACIFSQLDGAIWRRSRTRLTVIDSSRAATREDVIGGYLKSGSESTKYLNTGTDGTGIVGAKKG